MGQSLSLFLPIDFPYELGNPHDHGMIVTFTLIYIPIVVLTTTAILLLRLFLLLFLLLLLLLSLLLFLFLRYIIITVVAVCSPHLCTFPSLAFVALHTPGLYNLRLDHPCLSSFWTAPGSFCHPRWQGLFWRKAPLGTTPFNAPNAYSKPGLFHPRDFTTWTVPTVLLGPNLQLLSL
jgi:hypothetical protein